VGAGGGFGGWRSSSDLGQLGHPPELKGYLETAVPEAPPDEPPVRAVEG
jgi:hypothetical protein